MNIIECGCYALDFFSEIPFVVVTNVTADVITYRKAPFYIDNELSSDEFSQRCESATRKLRNRITSLDETGESSEYGYESVLLVEGMENALDGGEPVKVPETDIIVSGNVYALNCGNKVSVTYQFGDMPYDCNGEYVLNVDTETYTETNVRFLESFTSTINECYHMVKRAKRSC